MLQHVAIEEFHRGVELLQRRCPEQALLHIERAFHIDGENPYYISYMGLAVGVARKQWAEAEIFCQKAVKMHRNQPVLYLNLAEVYRRSGRKEDAVAALERGLLNTGNAKVLRNALGKLSRRRRPAIPFLNRNHKVNRKLGELRQQIGQLLHKA